MTHALAFLGLVTFGAVCAAAGYALAGLSRLPDTMTTEEVLRRTDNVVPLTPRERIALKSWFGSLDDDLYLPENAGA